MDLGWTKSWRKRWESDLATYPNANHLFQYLIDMASYKERDASFRYQCVRLQAGDVLIGSKSVAARTGLTRQSVRTCLEYLKSTNRITIRSTKRFSIVTILKWDTYQGDDTAINQENNHQANHEVTINQPSTNHIQEVKKVKKNRKPPTEYTPEFLSFWEGYPRHIGKQYAFECFTRVVRDFPPNDVVKSAGEFAKKCREDKTEEKYIPHPSTFLNKSSWKDYCFEDARA